MKRIKRIILKEIEVIEADIRLIRNDPVSRIYRDGHLISLNECESDLNDLNCILNYLITEQ